MAVLAGTLIGGPAGAGGETGGRQAALAEVERRLTAIDGAPVAAGPRPITLRYEGGRIAGFAGCNRYFASLEVRDGDAVSVGTAGATRMACPEPQMAIESRFLKVLAGTRGAQIVDGRLVLRGPLGSLEFSGASP